MRLWTAIRTDILLQARNHLYGISICVSLLGGVALAWLSPVERLGQTIPMAVLMAVGGSTLLYIVAMVMLEKDDGTLHAIVVTPLRPWEYLASKVVTLSLIATLEGVIIAGGTIAILTRSMYVVWPGVWFLIGLVILAIFHVLVGIIIVVRHDRFLTALLPMGAVATVLQLPALYVIDAIKHPLLLLIPTTGPTKLMQAGFSSLQTEEWLYALGYTAVATVTAALVAMRSFHTFVVEGLR
ncbi:MAG: hypothetical protein KTR25_00285 [Myxococcales bacterium]|nr:hypothetical protein [Myxococcales bacterium]